MQAIEFQTRITNGAITIPLELTGKLRGLGLVRVIVLAEEESASAVVSGSADLMEKEYLLANQTAAERGAILLRESKLHQAEISAAAAAALAEMGISGEPVGAQKLREMMLADGINPEDNEFSRGIIEMREE